MAALLAGYGWLLRHGWSLALSALVVACWLAAAGWGAHRYLRQFIPGLDYIALSLGVLGLAIAVSLGKSAARSRWLAAGIGKGGTTSGPKKLE